MEAVPVVAYPWAVRAAADPTVVALEVAFQVASLEAALEELVEEAVQEACLLGL